MLSLAATLLLAVGAALAQWDLESILSRAEQRYGELGAAKSRLGDWGRLLEQGGTLDEAAKLRAVNDFFNQSLRFTDDIEIWRQEDYWATPVEALVKGAADCEDYAIAKYVTLRRLGVASDKLRITYVKALRLNQAHMVLTWYASPGADPLVLDNLIGEIRPASQRDDLLPVYAFNAEGLWLPGPDGGRRTGDSKKLSRWQDLLTKMRAEGLDLDAPKED
ncbi:transglutaminase-like cysteine peptidase [Pseudomonas aeruginosa]|uniref:cysteine protease LapG n=1 Tax=Pseudomonas aeruginosa TaxID=287 RepID=UPI000F89574D|nr:transglutaminase-like cysteine peptidase [Pseudomonas aeruginosa]MCO3726158.1 hypothetical protein [Pseudomonas aeruginosa]MDF5798296.1 transglutaminase-like cysteine peptidase [Pseudomonas aeruginosa]MDF5808899.1 transglutaminase-like cysteine peptidase [Pseudomonas aeruginosa]MDF5886071.1 transglutaminase-like cysteine peptidase [Pseudomonas aeruginosa]MDF5917944.1 transglutaminase-like cysteine peptidase [Pseudomonas aeruginosa]